MRRKKTNPRINRTIDTLYEAARKHDAAIWRAVAKKLEKPAKSWAEVNVGKLVTHLQEGEIALVPGKVLGMGDAEKVEIAAWKFSKSAREKIEKAGGKCYSIVELIEKNPKGSNVRIIGG
ncbi:MAG TPA: 50S ribosomal protein L18e [Thermoplasmatales archaeon]|nr:MAG: 50S ribosomal protein L18e [Thermoplasmata archaeon]RLF33645.1 MAG: 50S ribosomal protein L18e [Thermoplasmata archaeon]HDN50630.1 50S ribosomal protein L18e [Thermoplasmatales archaeon]